MNTKLSDQFGELKCEIQDVKREWHDSCTSQCLGPVADHFKEEIIDLTVKMDDTREALGEPKEIEY